MRASPAWPNDQTTLTPPVLCDASAATRDRLTADVFSSSVLSAAELVRRPVTTIGLLAQALPPDAQFDTSRRVDRTAFVDALLALGQWGVVRATAGSVDAFVEDERGNAILTADTARAFTDFWPPLVPLAACPTSSVSMKLPKPSWPSLVTARRPVTLVPSRMISDCCGPVTAWHAACSTIP